jgi:hypothetical protein
VCVTPGQGDRTRLAVGAVDGTAGYPRTAKSLQFGGRFDSERGTLARIHIPQLSERLCGAGLVLARSSRECGGLGQVAWSGDAAGGLVRGVDFVKQLPVGGHWVRAVCGSNFFVRGCEVECAGNGRGGGISI